MAAHRLRLGRGRGRAPVPRRPRGGARGHHRRLRRRARPARPGRAGDGALPGAEPLQLPAWQRLRRDPRLRPHARHQRRGRAGAQRRATGAGGHRVLLATGLVAPPWLGRRAAAGTGGGGDHDPQGRVRRCPRQETVDVEGHRRHRRDHLAGRLQPLAPARPQRLLPAAGLEHLCRGRPAPGPDRARWRSHQPHRDPGRGPRRTARQRRHPVHPAPRRGPQRGRVRHADRRHAALFQRRTGNTDPGDMGLPRQRCRRAAGHGQAALPDRQPGAAGLHQHRRAARLHRRPLRPRRAQRGDGPAQGRGVAPAHGRFAAGTAAADRACTGAVRRRRSR